jgi:hypothetical protein
MYQILKKIAHTGIVTEPPPAPDESLRVLHERLADGVLRWFAGALTIRHVDAGSKDWVSGSWPAHATPTCCW